MNINSAKSTLFHLSFVPNIPIIFALIILASAPFFILQNDEGFANTFAGYALYLLIVGVLGKIMIFLISKNNHEKKPVQKY